MSDKMRKEFKVFWKEKILDAGWTLSKTESYFVWKRAWQASRQYIKVKLPKSHYDPHADDYTKAVENGKELILDDVIEALDAAGVSYE